MTISFEESPGLTMERLARKFREDASQATARLAVATGKNLANKTEPWGLTSKAKKIINEKMERAARRVCYVVKDARYLKKLEALGPRARIKFRNWEAVSASQIMRDPKAINAHIDKLRGGRANPPRWIPWSDVVLCSETVFARVMTARRKRAGIHKGGWLGAGIESAGMQGGPARAKIGKNVAFWAQKHTRMGNARRSGDRRYITLVNKAVAAERLLGTAGMAMAFDAAERDTISWYQKQIRFRERDQR